MAPVPPRLVVGGVASAGVSLVVAVTAVCSVGFLADRVSSGLNDNAGQVLGADLLFESDTPIEPEVVEQAHAMALQTAKTWQFPSMVTFDKQSRLASIKVVSEGYPLKGTVTLQGAGDEANSQNRQAVQRIPPAGTVWVDPALLAQLQASPEAQLRVGMKTLQVSAIIENEPDRNVAFVNIAPRLMMNEADMQATGLLVPGSRVKETLLMAGDAEAVAQMRTWLTARPAKGARSSAPIRPAPRSGHRWTALNSFCRWFLS
ncbi:membrane protein [Advenella kashmirensis WT001]|uniref:Membrane protein n=1 Tax=Advenella kashmirensis (strain DSM 17095 / LMG 22695 / WT001) TaxID=1036672 RepID=I3UDL7_ADVKW|nr:membrane protein [Advenella kashmirensis]AFK63105.1 membrane protein [Advenella kashmirensis WT001]